MVVSGPHSVMAYPWAQPPLRRGSSPGLQRCGSGTSEFFGWAALRGIGTNPAQPAQGVGRRKLHGGNRGVRKPGSTRQQIGLTAGETAPIPSATRRFPVAPATGLRLECVAATSTRMLVTAGKDRPIQRAGTWHELRATSARHWPMTHGRDRGAVESANSARHGGECNLPAHQKPIDLQRERLAADPRFAGWVAGQPETMA